MSPSQTGALEEFKGRQLVSGRKVSDVADDESQLKADFRAEPTQDPGASMSAERRTPKAVEKGAESVRQTYEFSVTDPETKKVRTFRSKIPSEVGIQEKSLDLIAAGFAHQYGFPRESVTATRGGERLDVSEKTGEKLVKGAAEALPYAALGLVGPGGLAARAGGWLAKNPNIVGGIVRSLGAGGIGAGEAAMKKEAPAGAGVSSALVQGGLEAITPPIVKGAQRLGGGALRRMEDEVADKLMKVFKKTVPVGKALPKGHEGIAALVHTGEGPELMAASYMGELKNVKDAVKGMRVSIPQEDALQLGLDSGTPVQALYNDLIKSGTAPAMAKAEAEKRIGAFLPEAGMVPVLMTKLIDKLPGLEKKNIDLAQRTIDVLDKTLPESLGKQFSEARRTYKEGMGFIGLLKDSASFDQRAGRLNLERMTLGSRTQTGKTTPVERYAKDAPDVVAGFNKIVPPTGKAPRAGGVARTYLGAFGPHIKAGEEKESVKSFLGQTKPRIITFSENVPYTEKEKQIQQLAPGALHGLGVGASEMVP